MQNVVLRFSAIKPFHLKGPNQQYVMNTLQQLTGDGFSYIAGAGPINPEDETDTNYWTYGVIGEGNDIEELKQYAEKNLAAEHYSLLNEADQALKTKFDSAIEQARNYKASRRFRLKLF